MPHTSPHIIHLWLTRLGSSADDFAALTQAEHTQALQFSRAETRLRYLRVRAAVRRSLAAFSGLPPAELVFDRLANGKPVLVGTPIGFNISHTGDCLAVAMTREYSLGVDLEQASARRNWQGIAQRYFHSNEVAHLQSLQPAAQMAAFYRLWTLKEAFFKARGSGISAGLQRIAFEFDGGGIEYQIAPELQEDSRTWRFWQWQTEGQLTLALACQSPLAPSLKVQLVGDPAAATLLDNLHLLGTS